MKSHLTKIKVKESCLYNPTVKGIMINVEDKGKFINEVKVQTNTFISGSKELLRAKHLCSGTIEIQGKEYCFVANREADRGTKPISFVKCNTRNVVEEAIYGNYIIFNIGTSFPYKNMTEKDKERIDNSFGIHFWEGTHEGPFLVIHS